MTLLRREQPELLDLNSHRDLPELRQNLDDMARYARVLGITRYLKRRLPRGMVNLLEVGCGSGALLRVLACDAGIRGVGVDLSSTVLQLAQGPRPTCLFVQADGSQLPFSSSSFDAVICVHTLHHLSPPKAARLLAECARVARARVICVDLQRSVIGLVGAWLLTRLTSRNRLTRADGVTSVWRAYTPQEACGIAQSAGWANFRVQRVGVAGYALVLDCPVVDPTTRTVLG